MRNEYVRASVGVDSIEDKMAQGRLRWFGHVSRKGTDDEVRKVWRWNGEAKMSRVRAVARLKLARGQ